MSAQNPSSVEEWYTNLPIPFLSSGPNGQAEAATWPRVLDQQIALARSARKASMPDYAPVDALPHIGGDRQLIQGASETNASFQARLRDPWSQWSRAGTALGVLEQLGYYGMTGAVWVQQNGLEYTLSAPPTAGVDPTPLLVSSDAPALLAPMVSDVNPLRSIPAGTPWFAFDQNTDLCNRFAIILPSWPFAALVQANFVNSDDVTIAWPWTFTDASYGVIVGPPSENVTVWAGAPQRGFLDIFSSAPWTGSVWVIAFAAGVNPLNVWTSTSAGAVQRIISTFRPNAICTGVYVINGGELWDYPTSATWDGDSNAWDLAPPFNFQVLGAF